MSTSAVDDVVGGIKWVSSDSCVRVGLGATLYDVEATGVDRFPTVRGVLTLRPVEAALLGGESLKRAVLFASEDEVEPLGFLSGIGKRMFN